jgi:hypothetical protein
VLQEPSMLSPSPAKIHEPVTACRHHPQTEAQPGKTAKHEGIMANERSPLVSDPPPTIGTPQVVHLHSPSVPQ